MTNRGGGRRHILQDLGPALMLHRVRWNEGDLLWSEGPENPANLFKPVTLLPRITYRIGFLPSVTGPARLLIQLGTFGHINGGRLTCRLRGPSGTLLDETKLEASGLVDCGFADVLSLNRAIYGARHTVELSLDAGPGNALALFTVEDPHHGRLVERRLESGPATAGQTRLLQDRIHLGDLRHPVAHLARGDRVLVCTHALPPGGAERQWIYLAMGLRRAGFDVRFVLYDEPEGANAHYLPLLRSAGIPIAHLGNLPAAALRRLVIKDKALAALLRSVTVARPDRLARFALLFRQLRPRAVFAQLDDTNLYAGLAALVADVPRMVVSFRNSNPTHLPGIHQGWFASAYAWLSRSPRILFTGNSQAANRDYEAWLGLSPATVAFIPNAISLDHFAHASPEPVAACRASLGLALDNQLVLGVFRLSPEKNPAAFITVFATLCAERPKLRGAIVGIGPLQSALESQIAAAGLSHNLTMLGRREDVGLLMSAANLLLLTSDHEGMPNVVLEAQAMGLPVVATDTGATGEAILPGLTGELCRPGDIAGLTTACARLLDDPPLAARMGAAGIRHAQKFDVDTLALRYAATAGYDASRRHVPPPIRWLAGLLSWPAGRWPRGPMILAPDPPATPG